MPLGGMKPYLRRWHPASQPRWRGAELRVLRVGRCHTISEDKDPEGLDI